MKKKMKRCAFCNSECKYVAVTSGDNTFCKMCCFAAYSDQKISWFTKTLLKWQYADKKKPEPAISVLVTELINRAF